MSDLQLLCKRTVRGLSATAPFFLPCTVLKGVARIVSPQVAGKHQLEEHFLRVLAFIRNQGWTEVDPPRTAGLVLFQPLLRLVDDSSYDTVSVIPLVNNGISAVANWL